MKIDSIPLMQGMGFEYCKEVLLDGNPAFTDIWSIVFREGFISEHDSLLVLPHTQIPSDKLREMETLFQNIHKLNLILPNEIGIAANALILFPDGPRQLLRVIERNIDFVIKFGQLCQDFHNSQAQRSNRVRDILGIFARNVRTIIALKLPCVEAAMPDSNELTMICVGFRTCPIAPNFMTSWTSGAKWLGLRDTPI